MSRAAALLALLALGGGAFGQAYECRTPSGNIVRQYGVPCRPGADTQDPALEAARRKERDLEAEKKKKAQEMDAAVERRDIRVGMTPEQVVQAWGHPASSWLEETPSGIRQVWTWRCTDPSRPGNLIAFQKGVVSVVQRPCL